MSLRLTFMGTPEFAVPALTELVAAGHEVARVYTQPPRPAGRGKAEQMSAVHCLALELGLEVATPARFGDPGVVEAFADLDLDAAVVVAYGQILPRAALDAPRLGCFNLHASLLPRWRGAAPIQRAIMAGDTLTGVQVMRMEEGLDTGPILVASSLRIFAFETAETLHDRLAVAGAQLLAPALAALERGVAEETPQAAEGVTYAAKIDKAEARISWSASAVELDRKVRGLSPFPGAWFHWPGPRGLERVKVMSCALDAHLSADNARPGEVLDDTMRVATGDGVIQLTRLQREGRRAQDAEDFCRGNPTPPGTLLE